MQLLFSFLFDGLHYEGSQPLERTKDMDDILMDFVYAKNTDNLLLFYQYVMSSQEHHKKPGITKWRQHFLHEGYLTKAPVLKERPALVILCSIVSFISLASVVLYKRWLLLK
jgi:hypothetical protein